MMHSSERILTTHVGSLPRPDSLLTLMTAKDAGQPYDRAGYAAALLAAVAEIVRRQIATGIDVIDDGEQSKPGFVAYVNERLGGFEPMTAGPGGAFSTFLNSREYRAFPEFYRAPAIPGAGGPRPAHMVCAGKIIYKGQAALQTDLDNLKAALAAARAPAVEAFVPAASPASIEGWQRNAYYKSDQDYLFAIADAMGEEYRAIVNAGFLVQIDDPWITTRYVIEPEWTIAQCRDWAELRIAALNRALNGIPPQMVRHHTCYGINMGPRVHDMELKDILDIVLKVRAGAFSFEAANPRHEHEWRLWEKFKLPPGAVLIPGVISHTTVLVEHPELIAERLARFASVVGRENVIAGADCGFATHPMANPEIHATIAWAKLAAMVEGAKLATKALWGRR